MSASELSPIVVEELKDLDPSKILISGKKTRTFNYKDKNTGQTVPGSQSYVEVYYGENGNKLQFQMSDIISYKGIENGSQKKAYMRFSLQDEVSNLIKEKIHKPLIEQLFRNRKALIPKDKYPDQSFLEFNFKGLVSIGDTKDEKTGEKWNDSLTANVMMKKHKGQWTVDDNVCQVEDLDGKTYSWTALGGKKLSEVIVEVDKMRLEKKWCYSCAVIVRGIVPEEKAIPKVISKRRRLMQMKAAEEKIDEPVAEADVTTTQASKKQRLSTTAASVSQSILDQDPANRDKKRLKK